MQRVTRQIHDHHPECTGQPNRESRAIEQTPTPLLREHGKRERRHRHTKPSKQKPQRSKRQIIDPAGSERRRPRTPRRERLPDCNAPEAPEQQVCLHLSVVRKQPVGHTAQLGAWQRRPSRQFLRSGYFLRLRIATTTAATAPMDNSSRTPGSGTWIEPANAAPDVSDSKRIPNAERIFMIPPRYLSPTGTGRSWRTKHNPWHRFLGQSIQWLEVRGTVRWK